jgi:hypothetical protein
MNVKLFKTWFQEKFLSYLALESVIVTDNGNYHSDVLEKLPTTSNKKN